MKDFCMHANRQIGFCLIGLLWACVRPRSFDLPVIQVLENNGERDFSLRGDSVDARHGDYFIETEQLIVVIQKPIRDMNAQPYGGNIIDFALKKDKIDRFGEISPFFNMGRTARFNELKIVDDGGGDHKPIVIEAYGKDVVWDYFNLKALMPDLLFYRSDGSGLLKFDPDKPLGLEVRARYEISQSEPIIIIKYSLTNTNNFDLPVQFGIGLDTGGKNQFFSHGGGFSSLSGFDVAGIAKMKPTDLFYALISDDVAYGIKPLFLNEENQVPAAATSPLSVAGLSFIIYGSSSFLEAATRPSLSIAAHQTITYSYLLEIGQDLSSIYADFLRREQKLLQPVHVNLLGLSEQEITQSTRFVVVDKQDKMQFAMKIPMSQFDIELPSGAYRFLVYVPGRNPVLSSLHYVQEQSTLPTQVSLSFDRVGFLSFHTHIFDDIGSSVSNDLQPCRLDVFDADEKQIIDSQMNSYMGLDTVLDINPQVLLTLYLKDCQKVESKDWLALLPGRYWIQLSKGPFYDTWFDFVQIEEMHTHEVSAVLHRVVDDARYVSADFHQHTVNSPDSKTAIEDRALAYVAEGIEFFTSSDHDRVTDYAPYLEKLGLSRFLKTAIGIEVTPFAFGHFNAWPILKDSSVASNGAIDWGRDGELLALTPDEIFKTMRLRGAAIVQANHPRNPDNSMDFQAYFDRSGLMVDPKSGFLSSFSPYLFVSPSLLRLPEQTSLFSQNFDAIEILNGFHFSNNQNMQGRIEDTQAEAVMRDWFAFLNTGFLPAIVGVSDSHKLINETTGYPRTLVNIDKQNIDVELVARAVKQGRAVATNAPFVDVLIKNIKTKQIYYMGDVSQISQDDDLVLLVYTQTPPQFSVDKVEVFVNTFAASPLPVDMNSKKRINERLMPTYERNLTPVLLKRPNGGQVFVSYVEIPLHITRDAFVVARVSGQTPLFPFLPTVGSADKNFKTQTASQFFIHKKGAVPLAITNPIYVDRDGDGQFKAPFQRQ